MTFEEIVRKPQSALKQALLSELNRMGYRTVTKHGFLYAEGSVPVMLVAHLDTVHRGPVKTICTSKGGRIIMSPQGIGGDDRAGVYMILELIKSHRCHVLFCEDEEVGGIGAAAFVKSGIRPQVNYIVELDRRGEDDAVFYDCDNPEFTEFVCGFGFKEAGGSFSDISIIAPELGIAGVNLSAGYYHEHTLHEYVDMDVVRKNTKRVEKMVSVPSDRFEYVEALRFGGWLGDLYWESGTTEPRAVRRLKTAAGQFGVLEHEVELLLDYGYDLDQIELLLNSPTLFRQAVREIILEETPWDQKEKLF